MSKRNDDDRDGYPVGRGEDPNDPLGGGDTPVDLGAVQADDAFLDMLGRADAPINNASDAELARVLVAWRREIGSEPAGELVSTDTAVRVLNSARRRRTPRRHPVLAPVAAAAAVLVIAFSAVGLVAKSAKPGDELFALTEVLYADYARSVQAAYQVQADLDRAKVAFEQGRTEEAKASLDRAEAQLEVIAPNTEERTDLIATYQELRAMVGDSDEPGSPGDGTGADPGDDPAQPGPPVDSATPDPSTAPEPSDPSTSPSPTSPPDPTDEPNPGSPEPTPRSATPDRDSGGDPADPGPEDPGPQDPGPRSDPGPDPSLPSPSVLDAP